jgi:hypothetical protein
MTAELTARLWAWAVKGLQGGITHLQALEELGKPDPAALRQLETAASDLREMVERLKGK